ncbi:MAG: hypothetical protein KKB51_16340 [Candidatus Riflebacteria bacterium]|nr:hypothetical protein [Candidatus Riflebacteria bacterium]
MKRCQSRRGLVIVLVVATLTTSLIFAAFLLTRSLGQNYEKIATSERTQLELLCISVIEAAKLKIRANPTELYAAFRYMHDLPVAKRTDALYNAFLNDLKLEVIDNRFAVESPGRTARVTSIERIGLTKRENALEPGYTEDYIRITAAASSQILLAGDLKSDVTMKVTIQMLKMEDR